MSSSLEFVQYVCDQLNDAGLITFRKMFGEYGIYCDAKFIGVICSDQLYVKITEAGAKVMPDCEKGEPYEGAKPYFLIENIEDREKITAFVTATCNELPNPKPQKKPVKNNKD